MSCMDIKKYINSQEYDNMASILADEIQIIKNSNINRSIDDGMAGLFNISELKFFNLKIDEIESLYNNFLTASCLDEKMRKYICLSGPIIKSLFDSNIINFNRYCLVDIIGPISDNFLGKSFSVDGIEFKINRKQYKCVSHALLNREALDRVGWFDGLVWVGGSFINELFKKLSNYDLQLTDPVFGITQDFLNISKKRETKESLKNTIERLDIKRLETLDDLIIRNTIISYGLDITIQ